MMLNPRHGAENLFRPPEAAAGSDAEKLQKLRERLQLRKREVRLQEKQSREEGRQERVAASRTSIATKKDADRRWPFASVGLLEIGTLK